MFFNDADTVIRVEAPGKNGTDKMHTGDVLRIVSEKTRDSDEFATLTVTAERDEWPDERQADGWARSLVIVPYEAADVQTAPPQGGARDVLAALSNTDMVRFPHGLSYMEWFNAVDKRVGLSRGTFDRHRRALMKSKHVLYDLEHECYRTVEWLYVEES